MPYLTPETIPEGTVCRPLFIPASSDWLAIVSGAITELVKTWNWQEFGSVTVDEAIALMQTMVELYYSEECCMPNPDCLCPPIFRLGTLGQQQVSFDAGETWEDVATPPLPIPPAIGGQSSQCLSARNLTEVIRLTYLETVAAFQASGTILLGIAAFISVLATTIFFPPAAPLVTIFFGALWEVLAFLVAGDFSTAVTEELTCFIYNTLAEDADGRWLVDVVQLLTDIEAAHPAENIWSAIGFIIQAAGAYSVQQALQTRSIQSYDCASCEPVGDMIAFAENGSGWTTPLCTSFRPDTIVTNLGPDRWRVEAEDGGDGWYAGIRRSANGSFQISNIDVISGNLFFFDTNIVTEGCSAGGGTIAPGVSVFSWTQIGQYASGQLILEFDVLLT